MRAASWVLLIHPSLPRPDKFVKTQRGARRGCTCSGFGVGSRGEGVRLPFDWGGLAGGKGGRFAWQQSGCGGDTEGRCSRRVLSGSRTSPLNFRGGGGGAAAGARGRGKGGIWGALPPSAAVPVILPPSQASGAWTVLSSLAENLSWGRGERETFWILSGKLPRVELCLFPGAEWCVCVCVGGAGREAAARQHSWPGLLRRGSLTDAAPSFTGHPASRVVPVQVCLRTGRRGDPPL